MPSTHNFRYLGWHTATTTGLIIWLAIGVPLPAAASALASAADNREGVWIIAPGQSIQQAIDDAAPGQMILVQPGTYAESLTIDKPDLTLRSLEDHQAIVRGLVSIEADGVTLAGMTIQRVSDDQRDVTISVRRGHVGVTLANNVVDGQNEGGLLSRGIRLSSAGAVVRDNTVRNHTGNGIWVETGEYDVLITGNLIQNNRDGLNFQNSDDSHVVHIQITDNHFIENRHAGIAIGRWVWSDRFTITGNRIDPGENGRYYVCDWRYDHKDDDTPSPGRDALVAHNCILATSHDGHHWFWEGGGWRLKPGPLVVNDGQSHPAAGGDSPP